MDSLNGITLAKLLNQADIGVVIHNIDTTVVYANPAALRLLRLSYNQLIGSDAFDSRWQFLDEDRNPLPLEEFPVNKVIRHGKPIHNVIMGVVDSSDTGTSWFRVNGYIENSSESNGFIVVTFNDITDAHATFSFEDILHNIQDVVVVTEADNINSPFGPKIVYVNKAFEKLTGFSREEAIGETPRILQGKDTCKETRDRIRRALESHHACTEKILNYTKKGRPYWLEINIIPLRNRFGKVTHFAAIERDVTEATQYADTIEKRNKDLKELKINLEDLVRQRTQELEVTNNQLQRQAYYDSLTGLPNRRGFLKLAEQQVARMHRSSQMLLVGILDIDNFKNVNDTLGHETGDQVLTTIGEIILHHFRQEDAYCRYGGEEFAFAILVKDSDVAHDVCERLRCFIEHEKEIVDELSISVTASIGYCLVPADSFIDLETCINDADIALYEAKRRGRNCVLHYTPAMKPQS